MDNKIVLSFDKTITRLAGHEYGKREYNAQCQGKIDFNKKITIEFPDNIEKLASSFVQGFFEEFVQNIGLEGIENNVNIISRNDIKEQILNNLI